ncbi:MAG: methyltransferase domain-containing protein [Pseudomonadota bacterium]
MSTNLAPRDADGYILDIPYVPCFNSRSTPVQVAMAARAAGVPAPDLEQPFRYADLGCGTGITLLVLAAAYPDSQFFGIDINEARIEEARARAKRCGLANVQFIAGAFSSPAAQAIEDLDFATAYGIYSWVSARVRGDLFALLARSVKPDGLALVSYNTQAGYGQTVPVRDLMRRLIDGFPGDLNRRRRAAIDALHRMSRGSAPYFEQHPLARALLADWQPVNFNYIVHEFLNESWYPASFGEVASDMAAVGFHFSGDSAYLLSGKPSWIADHFEEIDDPVLLEDLTVFGNAHPFRVDVFSRQGPMAIGRPPLIHDEELFGTVWPAATRTMQQVAAKGDPTSALMKRCLSAPKRWGEIRRQAPLDGSMPAHAAAVLRDAMCALTMTRYRSSLEVRPLNDTAVLSFSSKLSEDIANDRVLADMPQFFPAPNVGGVVPVPPTIVQVIAAAEGQSSRARWEERTLERLLVRAHGGEKPKGPDEMAALRERIERAISQVQTTWAPFLAAAGILRSH